MPDEEDRALPFSVGAPDLRCPQRIFRALLRQLRTRHVPVGAKLALQRRGKLRISLVSARSGAMDEQHAPFCFRLSHERLVSLELASPPRERQYLKQRKRLCAWGNTAQRYPLAPRAQA